MDNYIVKLDELLSKTFETPKSYGPYHLICFGIVVALTVLLCVFFRNCKDRTLRIILAVALVAMVSLEFLDEFADSVDFNAATGLLELDYPWYRFPFQLCSTIIWVSPFVIFLPEGKVRDAAMAYLALFSFFGGLAVMIYPNDVFTSSIITCIHTMVHHGLQVALGIFIFVHERKKYGIRHFLGAVVCFMILLSVATALNEVVHQAILAFGSDNSFNMFYISRHYECTLPVLSSIYPLVPYPVFFIIYSLGFVLVAFIIYFVQLSIYHLVTVIKDKVRSKKANAVQE